MASSKNRGPRVISVDLTKGRTARVYANAKVASALAELSEDMSLYHGVRMTQVMEAVYEQGIRDGRAQVMAALDGVQRDPALKHRNPGRPRKRR